MIDFYEIMIRYAALRGDERILILMPGPSWFRVWVDIFDDVLTSPLQTSPRVVVIDSDESRLRQMVTRRKRCVLGQATRLPFHRHTFEAILSFEALYSIRPPWTALAEFHRVLVPEGKLVLFEPQSLGFLSSLRDKVSGPGKRVFPLEEIKSRLARGDYSIDAIEELPAVKGYPRPAYCIRAIKRENPAEPVPQFLTAREMMERRKKAHPAGEELP